MPNILYHTKTASPLLTQALELMGGGGSALGAAKVIGSSVKPTLSNLINVGMRKTPWGKRYVEKQLGDSFARGYAGKVNASGHVGKLVESAKNLLMSNSEEAHHIGRTVRKSFPEMEPSDMAFFDHLRKGRPDRAQKVLDKYPRTREKVRNLIGGEPDLSHPRVSGGAKDIMNRLLSRDKATREETRRAVEAAKPIGKGIEGLTRMTAHVLGQGGLNGPIQGATSAIRYASESSSRVKNLVNKASNLLPRGNGHNKLMDTIMGTFSPSTGRSYGNLVNSLRRPNG